LVWTRVESIIASGGGAGAEAGIDMLAMARARAGIMARFI
jgi:hypothetical protein